MPQIAILWDFDGTLTPQCSTSLTVRKITEGDSDSFWDNVKELRKKTGYAKEITEGDWKHLLAMDAPIWMYTLGQVANNKGVPLRGDFFKEIIAPDIELFDNMVPFLQAIKDIANDERFKAVDLKIEHFIVSAGLKDLIEQLFPEGLIKYTYGCRYVPARKESSSDDEAFDNIPVFCMDETAKTRAIFEISKGVFQDENIQLNQKISDDKLYARLPDFVFIGDGDTDIPALSLVRARGGLGVIVYQDEDISDKAPAKRKEKIINMLKGMAQDKRADLITSTDYSLEGELFKFLECRCWQICQKYEAETFKL